jgi:hypothetical protein
MGIIMTGRIIPVIDIHEIERLIITDRLTQGQQ